MQNPPLSSKTAASSDGVQPAALLPASMPGFHNASSDDSEILLQPPNYSSLSDPPPNTPRNAFIPACCCCQRHCDRGYKRRKTGKKGYLPIIGTGSLCKQADRNPLVS